MSPNLTGAVFMVAAMACFTVNDALLKATNGEVPLFQLLFLRGVVATACIAMLCVLRGTLRVRVARRDWALIALRSVAELAAAYFFVTALLNMPLANVTALLQAIPLTVALGAALVFREAIGWRRMVAILLGFAGMLLIVRPGTEGFTVWSVYALVAVACVTVRDLSTRPMSNAVPSLLVTISASLTVAVASGLASLTIEWAPITPDLGLLIFSASIFVVGGYYFSVQVMRQGDVSFVAPFRYTGLIWALGLGWFVFGDWPRPLTLLGAGVIVGTGLFTLFREHRLQRRRL